jgi:hypothetical protein
MEPKFNQNEKIPPIEISPIEVEKAITDLNEHFFGNALRTVEENDSISKSYSENPEILKITKDAENKILTASRNTTKSVLQFMREVSPGEKTGMLFSIVAGFTYFVISNEISKKNTNEKLEKVKNDSELATSSPIDKIVNPEPSKYALNETVKSLSEKSKSETSSSIAEKIKNLQNDFDEAENFVLKYKEGVKSCEDQLQVDDISEEFIKEVTKDLNDCKEKYEAWLHYRSIIKEDLDMLKNYNKEFFEKQKAELVEHIKSLEYLQKLQKEFGLSKAEAKKHQDVRIKNLEIAHGSFQSDEQVKSKAPGASAYYIPGTTEVVISYDNDRKDVQQLISHELLHELTNAEAGMSKKATDLMNESYTPSEVLNKMYSGDDSAKTEYFGDPSERIVRKQILDLEMEELGIKKYEEPFTQAHYHELMKLLNAGKLSSGAKEFIMTTKPEYFERIFNELSFGRVRYRIEGNTFILESLIT